MTKYFTTLIALFCSSVFAQTYEWANLVEMNYSFNPTILHATAAVDNSGNPVCARLVNFREIYSTTAYGDIRLEKRNSSGSLLWQNIISGKVDVSKLIVDSEDNMICTGTYRDSLVIGTTTLVQTDPNQTSFILKTDASGNFIWVKDGTEFAPEYGIITALELKSPNNFLVGVTNYSVNANIYEFNPGGNVVSIIEQTAAETISDINVDISGNTWAVGFAFNGPVFFNGLDTIAPFSYNDYVVKYNSSGIAQWVSFIEDVTVQEFNIETDNSGNAYLSGNLFLSTHFGNLLANGPQWIYDFFVTKIDPDGNYLWLNEIPPGNTLGDATIGNTNFLSCGDNGDTYLTGFFRGEINFGNGVILNTATYDDLFVISYKQDGEIQWAKSASSASYDQGCGIITDNNGSCYVAGVVSQDAVFDTISVAGGDINVFLAKLSFDSPVSVEGELPGDISSADKFELMQNYPNPFNPSTSLQYTIGSRQFVTLKVYDLLGREVATLVNEEKPAGSYEVEFSIVGTSRDLSLTSGIYFYRLNAGSFTEVKKMILLR
jgi:hypothetical protein